MESGVELGGTGSVIVLAAGIVRKLDESVLAANVASGVGFDGDDDDAVNDGL